MGLRRALPLFVLASACTQAPDDVSAAELALEEAVIDRRPVDPGAAAEVSGPPFVAPVVPGPVPPPDFDTRAVLVEDRPQPSVDARSLEVALAQQIRALAPDAVVTATVTSAEPETISFRVLNIIAGSDAVTDLRVRRPAPRPGNCGLAMWSPVPGAVGILAVEAGPSGLYEVVDLGEGRLAWGEMTDATNTTAFLIGSPVLHVADLFGAYEEAR